MSYEEDEEVEPGFKVGADDEDEPLDIPEGDMPDFGDEEEEDPEDKYH